MPRKLVTFECKYCNKAFDDYNECEEHEETHIRDYSDAEIEEIVAKLRELSDLAPSYHIGGMVFGLPANSVQSLLETAAKRLEESK